MLVFVDGENFRQRLSEILVAKKLISSKDQCFTFDLAGLLSDAIGSDELEIMYYASEIKTPVGYIPSKDVQTRLNKIKENMRVWVASLKNQGITYIKAGNLKIKDDKICPSCHNKIERLQEKGVDVRLALDIFEYAMKKDIREIAVVSSDTDICPVYHKIKSYTRVKYICFADTVNRAVSAATDETITISLDKVKNFLKKRS